MIFNPRINTNITISTIHPTKTVCQVEKVQRISVLTL
jgi:hypothetical protein